MIPFIRKIAGIACVIITLGSSGLNGQILRDSSTIALIRQDIDHIYNFRFDDARKLSDEIFKRYPDHPIVFLIRGITTYWENYPLLPVNEAHELFETDMLKTIELAEENTSQGNEAEYLLATLCARGMLLMFYSDNDMISEVIPLAVSTYKFVRKSFDYTSECTDLYYFTGLYNYYREAYPKEYPVYKSLAILFPQGSTERGLRELKTCAENSVVLRPESYYLLTWIYLNFENNFEQGLTYTRSLHEKYIDNELYYAVYIKNLILLKQYDMAEKEISNAGEETRGNYFRAQLSVFKAIIQEKKYLNLKLAKEYYNEGIHQLSNYMEYSNEYSAYGYYGLSRISIANGEKNAGKIYRNQAEKMAEFKNIDFDK